MGLVVKQSFKNLITTYLGFGVGAANVLLLYPNFMEQKYYGLVTFLLSASTLVWPIMGFGLHNTLIKFYSAFQKKDQQHLLSMALFLPLFAGLILGGIGFIFYENILAYFTKNALIQPYVWMIFVIAVAIAYFEVFFAWAKLKLKSVFGNFMREVFHRVCVTILLLLLFYNYIAVDTFIYLLTGIYILRMFVMQAYAFWLIPPSLKFGLPSQKWAVLKYSFLILIVGSVGTVLLDLDKVMIEHYSIIEKVSVYSIAVYVASVIVVPSRAMLQITNPITAELINMRDKVGLKKLYKKSSISLLVISGIVFSLIIANVDAMYAILPEEYKISYSIVLLLSAIKLYDNLIGNNSAILFNSDYYRWALFIGVFVVILAVILNLLLIPVWDIYGAAIASFASFFVYNSMKLWIVYKKFGMHPFSAKTLQVILLITLITGFFYSIPLPFHPIASIAIKSVLLTSVYIILVFKLNLSDDISNLAKRFFTNR